MRSLKSVKSLGFAGTKLTDAGLKELEALNKLQVLSLNDTKVTDAGVMDLKRHLPKLRILR